MTEERWKDVPGYEGLYEVSTHGRVRSLPREAYGMDNKRRWRYYKRLGKELRATTNSWTGSPIVRLYQNRQKKDHRVSCLVARAFIGPCPPGMECCHEDGNPENNHLDNLRWDTHKANMADRDAHGRHARGSQSKRARLTEEDIPKIRQMLLEDTKRGRLNRIGRKFGVTVGCIYAIEIGQTWKHVP